MSVRLGGAPFQPGIYDSHEGFEDDFFYSTNANPQQPVVIPAAPRVLIEQANEVISPSQGKRRKSMDDDDALVAARHPRMSGEHSSDKHANVARAIKEAAKREQDSTNSKFEKRAPARRICGSSEADPQNCFKPVVLPIASTSSTATPESSTPAPRTRDSKTSTTRKRRVQAAARTTTKPRRTATPARVLAPGDPTFSVSPVVSSFLSSASEAALSLASIESIVDAQFSTAASVVFSRNNPLAASLRPSIESLFSAAATALAGSTAPSTAAPTTTSALPSMTTSLVSSTSSPTDSISRSASSTSSGASPSSTSASEPSYAERHKGAIIGGTLGGAAALALLILLICCLVRRKSKDDKGAAGVATAARHDQYDDDTDGRAIDAPVMSERNQSSQGSFGTSPSAVGVAYSPAEPRSRWGRRSLLDVMTAVIPGGGGERSRAGRRQIHSGSSFGGEPDQYDQSPNVTNEPVSYIQHQPSIYSDGTYQPGMPRPVTAQYGPDGSVMPAIRAVSPDHDDGHNNGSGGIWRPQPMRTETEYVSADERGSSIEEFGVLPRHHGGGAGDEMEEMGGYRDESSPEQQAVNFGSSSGSSNNTHGGNGSGQGGAGSSQGQRGHRGATPSVNSRSSTPSHSGTGAGHGQSIRKDGSWW